MSDWGVRLTDKLDAVPWQLTAGLYLVVLYLIVKGGW